MKKTGTSYELSATDLVGCLNWRHFSGLDRAVAECVLLLAALLVCALLHYAHTKFVRLLGITDTGVNDRDGWN